MSWSSPKPVRTSLVVTTLVASVMPSAAGRAQTVPKIVFSGSAQGSSNPFLLPGGDTGAVAVDLSVEPGVTFTDRNGTLDLAGVLTDRQYSRRYGNFLLGSLVSRANYRDSERLSASGSVSFNRDVSVDVVTNSIDALVDPRSIRNALAGRVALQWRPSAYTEIEPAVSAERNSYADSALLRNTRAAAAELSARRRISPTTAYGLRGLARWTSQATEPGSSVLAIYATLDKQLWQRWRLTAGAGAERTGVRETELADTVWRTAARIRPSATAEMCHTGERLTGCFNASLASEVSGLAGLQRRLAAAASLTRRMAQHIRLIGTAGYQRASIKAAALPALESIDGRVSLSWDFDPTFSLIGTVEYRRREDWTFGKTDAGFVGLELRYSPRSRS